MAEYMPISMFLNVMHIRVINLSFHHVQKVYSRLDLHDDHMTKIILYSGLGEPSYVASLEATIRF